MRIEKGDLVTIKLGVPLSGYHGSVRTGTAMSDADLWRVNNRLGVVLEMDDPERGKITAGPLYEQEIEHVRTPS